MSSQKTRSCRRLELMLILQLLFINLTLFSSLQVVTASKINSDGDSDAGINEHRHFVLVHGLGHGAWCWYRVTALLEAAGHTVTALDLTSNGIDKADADRVSTVAEFVKPLTDFLSSYNDDDSDGGVVLVGHSLGGSVISFAMELFPGKIRMAIFLAALMPADGQLFLPLTSFSALSNLLLSRIVVLNYGDAGVLTLPTSASINRTVAQPNFYNRSPPEDVALALACVNRVPFRPALQKLSLSTANYGSVPRFYVRTSDGDRIIPPSVQSSIIQRNPPDRVFSIPDSDHCPFFSRPSPLAKLLASIAAGSAQ